MAARTSCARAAGMTLVELVVAISVIAIAVVSVLGLLSSISVRSADTIIREQATGIASAYLNEVLQKSFTTVPGGSSRATFNDIGDYNGLVDSGASDQFGNAVTGASQFTVRVTVTPAALGAITSADSQRIDVAVTHPSGVTVLLSGYRTRHP